MSIWALTLPAAERSLSRLLRLGRYNGIQAPNMNYSCHSAADRGCHCWSSVQATKHGKRLDDARRPNGAS